jgi:hypothetical protein
MKQNESEIQNRQNMRVSGAQAGFIIDEDEKWEKEFEKIVDDQKEDEDKIKTEKRAKKELKKAKKKLKKEKKEKKKLKKEMKREQKLMEIYKSYGVGEIKESRSNVIRQNNSDSE